MTALAQTQPNTESQNAFLDCIERRVKGGFNRAESYRKLKDVICDSTTFELFVMELVHFGFCTPARAVKVGSLLRNGQ